MKKFMVGAGSATVHFPKSIFPTVPENYVGIHDDANVSIIILEKEERIVLMAADLVTLPNAEDYRFLLTELTGAKPENIILHNNHCTCVPHYDLKSGRSSDKSIFLAYYMAVKDAAEKAVAGMREGRFGYGEGYTDVHVNRIMPRENGYWQQSNPQGFSDHSMPVLRFEDVTGELLAVLYVVNCVPGLMDGSYLADGSGKLISADISGVASKFARSQYGENVVVQYLSGATGDQWQRQRSRQMIFGKNGTFWEEDMHERGYTLVDSLGLTLGQQVVAAADQIVCDDVYSVKVARRLESFEAQKRTSYTRPSSYYPHKDALRESAGKLTTGITIITIDDLAVICVAPEMQCRTALDMKESSPFTHTVFLGWTNYASNSLGSYMVEADMYENGAYQSFKSCWKQGTAEKMRDCVIQMLEEIYSSEN